MSLDIQLETTVPQPKSVECLGMTFENDEARRVYFTEKLREKLQDPQFRKIEGFPIGEDEDILALSDPPYYTACPNPFIEDFINYWQQEKEQSNPISETDNYHREPFAADVSEGKTDPIYLAHSYHTKVPPKAIARYLLWFTNPGDVILDAYSGSGMTGLAANICASPSPEFREKAENEWETMGVGKVQWGPRHVLLNDLSPAATFIAANYNNKYSSQEIEQEVMSTLSSVQSKMGWMYETLHNGWAVGQRNPDCWKNKQEADGKGRIVLVIWTEVLSCSHCTEQINLWKDALDPEKASIKERIICPNCGAVSKKLELQRFQETIWDNLIECSIIQNKFIPAFIIYEKNGKRFEKLADKFDLDVWNKIQNFNSFSECPIRRMMDTDGAWGNLYRSGYHQGISHIHHFFTKRNWILFSELWSQTRSYGSRFILTSLLNRMSKMSSLHMKNFFRGGGGFAAGNTKGNLYIPSFFIEQSPFEYVPERLKRVIAAYPKQLNNTYRKTYVSTGSVINLAISSNTVDYIFIDPPFGQNLIYSELNFIWEAWLRVTTDVKAESIVDDFRNKSLNTYQEAMKNGFQELYRVLKPNRWITIEFHNSQNSVWMAIQEALQKVGFIIADVRVLDKKQGSHKQNVAVGAVKKDLVISAYKPNHNFEKRFELVAGTEEGVWDFVRTHLQQLPVFVSTKGTAETIAERQNYLLFDRMVAFHIQRGITVPLSASEFYAGLTQRFTERDEMYFLPEQAAEYENKRITVKEILQLELVVINEETAVQWLKQQLIKKPQTFQEIHPQFMLSKAAWSKAEKPLELSDILEQNFLRYDGKSVIPQQIVSWLKQSSIYRDKINKIKENLPPDAIGLETNDPAIISTAKDKWYVPDPNRAIDLEKLREKALLKEFEEYCRSNKKLKVFRLEAVRAGFVKAWKDKNYQVIIDVAKKIPESVLQEDHKLTMLYDNAMNRTQQ